MRQPDLFRTLRKPWNAGRIIGSKAPLKPKHIWAIRQQQKTNGRHRDLAMFNSTIDAKLRACDLVRLTASPGSREPAAHSTVCTEEISSRGGPAMRKADKAAWIEGGLRAADHAPADAAEAMSRPSVKE